MAAGSKRGRKAPPRARRRPVAPRKPAAASLKQQLAEARAQQTATAAILKVISQSPTDTQPVFEAIVNSCLPLFGGMNVALFLRRAEFMDRVAFALAPGTDPASDLFPVRINPHGVGSRALLTKELVQVANVMSESSEQTRRIAQRMGFRSIMSAPLLREGEAIGAISVFRAKPSRFSAQHVELLKTVANQAVIAIENVRLFNETKEALERQTAISEILRVISSTPGNVQPVLSAVAERAARICDATVVDIILREGETQRVAATFGELGRPLGMSVPLNRDTVMGRSIVDGKPVQVADLQTTVGEFALGRELAIKYGHRSILAVPLMREGGALGTILVRRAEVRPFDEKHVALLQTFADQAAIAIDNARLFNETREALERQTATAEILKVISRSPTDVQPVFEAIVRSGVRLFEEAAVAVSRPEGGEVRLMAIAETDRERSEKWKKSFPFPLTENYMQAAAILRCAMVEVSDATQEQEDFVEGKRNFLRTGYRALTAAPMVRDGVAIGTITVVRVAPGPLSDKQKALLRTFADQAVIAIENVRLFNETREALERQTATAEILKVIADSPSDVQPVFDAIAASARRLLGGLSGSVTRVIGDTVHLVASTATSQASVDGLKNYYPRPLSSTRTTERVLRTGKSEFRGDYESDPEVLPETRELARARGFRSNLWVPLLRDGVAFGTINVARAEAGPFSDHQIKLLETFADQAVIAIQNASLFNETREALERQTATAEILKVIASSPSDVQPVFDAIAASARRLLGGDAALVARRDGDMLYLAAYTSTNEAADAALEKLWPSPITGRGHMGRAVLGAKPVRVEDVQNDTSYSEAFRASARIRGVRSVVSVPMLREGEAIGVISVNRSVAGRFSEHQTDLLRTFADQAVIAIENVRLFNETKEALDRQTATADVLAAISGAQTDVTPVFEAIARNAQRLCNAVVCNALRLDGDMLQIAASHGFSPEQEKKLREKYPVKAGDASVLSGRVIASRQIEQIDDIRADPDYDHAHANGIAGWRRMLGVPMLRDDVPLGVIVVAWHDHGKTPESQVALLKTFAAQAVIAIENVRLFNETREALERQTATAEILKVIASSPAEVQPVFDAIVRTAKRLMGAFSATVTHVGDGMLHLVAHTATTPEGAQALGRFFPIPVEGTRMGRAIQLRRPEFIDDFASDPAIPEADRELARSRGFRSVVFVPLVRGGVAIGSLNVTRREAGRMSDHQVDLLKTFADQAVIAIENVRLFNETKEALAQQTATAEILRVIGGSMTDTKPVFEAIVKNCHSLFGDSRVVLRLVIGGQLHAQASIGGSGGVLQIDRASAAGACVVDARTLHLPNLEAAAEQYPLIRQLGLKRGERSGVYAPLLRAGRAIGSISVLRSVLGAFSDKEVALLNTFADQAVIAIENVRLFNETKEALERQTATAEILKVISGSPTDVQPVLDAIAQSAANLFLCDAGITTLERDKIYLRAIAAGPGSQLNSLDEVRKLYPIPFDSTQNITSQTMARRELTEVMDTEAPDVSEIMKAVARALKFRSITQIPLVKDGVGIGTIGLARPESGFRLNEKQRALLQTFADQAVIAIENVRLFNETKEALEQQTATAEILQVISSSPTDTQPVFDAIVRSGLRLFPDAAVAVVLPGGGKARMAAVATQDPAQAAAWRARFPIPLAPNRLHSAAILECKVIDVPDAEAARNGPYAPGVENFLASGNRAITIAPMMCGDAAIGAISVVRQKAGALSEKQLALLRTFAAQAVIAIENVRVFKELEARTGALTRSVEQLTALGEVGQAISSTLDLETVLKTIVQRAVQITGLDGGSIYEYDEKSEEFHLRAAQNLSEEVVQVLRETPAHRSEGVIGRAVETGEPVEIAEMLDDSYQSPRRDTLIQAGYRALLVVPLRRDEHIIGALAVNRKAPGHFSHDVVELLKTFATQSAMAIQNARLFREIEEKGRQLEVASRHKSDFLASMSHELRTPLNAILGFNEMILGQVYGEVPVDMKEPLEDIQKSGKHLLRLINNVLDLAKIEAGRMELSLQDYSVHDTVESVRATLRPLAAEKGLEFLVALPPELPLAYGDSGRITQCLMNLAGNSLKFTRAGQVEIAVAEKDELLTFRVADTGIGIAPDKIGSLFTEFKQTDATIASEYGGTGLGLSISKKFVEMHGGRIWIESELGKGSVFIFEIPLRVQP